MAVQRVPGVREAEFSYEDAEGLVAFDPALTDPAAIIEELAKMTGFQGTVRELMQASEH